MNDMKLTQKSTVSIALGIVIVAGITANLSMMYSLRGSVALIRNDFGYVVNDLAEIKGQLSSLAEESQQEARSVREELFILKTRVTSLESE